MTDLTFNGLPDLPQMATLARIARALWNRDDVVALWLGGSFARGKADEYSDLDLRVAVTTNSLDAWPSRDLSALTGETVVGVHSLGWDGTVLHHTVLESGVILDLLVQGFERNPPDDFTLVLGCRDAALGERLARACLPPAEDTAPADPEAVRQVVADFWVGSHKYAKVLHRDLDMLVLVGLGLEQSVLMRLWYVEATGQDQGTQRATIHSLTQTVRTVMEATEGHGLETLGTPRGSRAEVMGAIETNRDEVSRVGRRLAERLGFEYPDVLERTVREAWERFLGVQEARPAWPRKKLGAAAVILNEYGHILLVKHGYGPRNWELPGGAAEARESVADTAVREVREETGLEVVAERLTGVYYDAEFDAHHFVLRCRSSNADVPPKPDGGEITECGYFPPDALPRPISDFTVRRIRDALTGQTVPLPVSIGPRQWLD